MRGLDPMKAYLAVVGTLNRPGSIVLAASPMMKKEFGIKTGSRLYEIPKNDPRIIVAEAKMATYLEHSVAITRFANKFFPMDCISVYSVDEFFAKHTPGRLFGDRWQMARRFKQELYETTGLICAIGIGSNKLLSKYALDLLAKKSVSGIEEVQYEEVQEKLWNVEIRDVWGIGARLEKRLHRLGIYRLGDIARCPLRILQKNFGIIGEQLYNHAWGIDLSPPSGINLIADQTTSKGVGRGITLLKNYQTDEVPNVINDLCSEVGTELRKLRVVGRTISLGIGYSRDVLAGGFHRAKTIEVATNVDMDIYKVCMELFKANDIGAEIRNVHVSVTNLEDLEYRQLSLFEDTASIEKKMRLGYVMDDIRNKYGADAIVRGSSLTKDGIAKDRAAKIGGHTK